MSAFPVVPGDPRKDPDAAYESFMGMPWSEWRGLLDSLMRGGVLEPNEKIGFARALQARGMLKPEGE